MNVTETIYELTRRGFSVRFEPGERVLRITIEKSVDGLDYYSRYVLGDPQITNPDHETDEVLIGLLNRMADKLEAHIR